MMMRGITFWMYWRSILTVVVVSLLAGGVIGYYANSRTIIYETNYDINQDGKLDLSDWSAFGTRLQEQSDFIK